MEIIKARKMGLCFGVRRAVEKVEEAARDLGPLSTLGPLVHNRRMVTELEGKGIRVVTSPKEVSERAVAIASHGAGPLIFREIKALGLKAIDATCPTVRRAQLRARELAEAGFYVIVFGNGDHPEVKGVLDWAGGRGRAMDCWEEFRDVKLPSRLGILGQTTQSPEGFSQFICGLLANRLPNLTEIRFHNTLCSEVHQRQKAARELAGKVDVIVIVGGKDSANTQRLMEICVATGTRSYHIEEALQLEPSWFQGIDRVGVTAGASTPDQAIGEVVSAIQKIAEERESQYAAH